MQCLVESNIEIRNALKENMKKWIQEGTQMSAQLDSLKGLSPTTNTTPKDTPKEEPLYPTIKKPDPDVPKEKPDQKNEEE